jgi:hypothetical protein
MEVPQGNSLCSYLTEINMSFFFFYKIGEQEEGIGPTYSHCGTTVGVRRWVKGVGE